MCFIVVDVQSGGMELSDWYFLKTSLAAVWKMGEGELDCSQDLLWSGVGQRACKGGEGLEGRLGESPSPGERLVVGDEETATLMSGQETNEGNGRSRLWWGVNTDSVSDELALKCLETGISKRQGDSAFRRGSS